MSNFTKIFDLAKYITEKGLQMKPAAKFLRIEAIPVTARKMRRTTVKPGTIVKTVLKNGTKETKNIANKGSYVVKNVGSPERWVVQGKTFHKKYEPVVGQLGVFKPKGGPMNAVLILEPISFTAPWGEEMNIDKGGYLLQDPANISDIYGIGADEFAKTYKFLQKGGRLIPKFTRNCKAVSESTNIPKPNIPLEPILNGTPLLGPIILDKYVPSRNFLEAILMKPDNTSIRVRKNNFGDFSGDDVPDRELFWNTIAKRSRILKNNYIK